MRIRRVVATCASIALLCGFAACGSSANNAERGDARGGTSRETIKVGLLTDVTGPGSSPHADDKAAASAYFNYVNSRGGVNGQKIELTLADTASSPTGALNAAHKLVEQDHVFAVLADSLYFSGTAQYLQREKVPVVGFPIGNEWYDPKFTSLFSAIGPVSNTNYMLLAQGQYFKVRGVTSCGAIGYTGSLASKQAAISVGKSCRVAGLKVGYLNTQIPIGSTDVGALALQIKKSGVDGLAVLVQQSTAFALLLRLHELGVRLKSFLLTSGYGSELLATASNVEAAQGVDFQTFGYPAEVHTPGTDLRRSLLGKAGLASPPSAGAQSSYLCAVAVVAGLKASGRNPSQATFITHMAKIRDFTGDGLLPNKIAFQDYAPKTACMTVVKLTGRKFVPMKPMPLCAPVKKVFDT